MQDLFLWFISRSVKWPVIIFSFDGSSPKSLFSVSGENLATDGTYLYYSVNKFLDADSSGIFRVSIEDLTSADVDPTPRKLTSAKASKLVVVNGYVYFSHDGDGQKLYRVPSGASDATPTLIYDYKVSDFALDGSTLFFTRHVTLDNLSAGATIYSIDLSGVFSEVSDDSSSVKKISYAKGKYLTIVGDYLYFVNTDMISSSLFGDGIYRVDKNGSDWQESIIGGTRVVDGEEDNLYSLSSDGENLYYYRASSKHLYRFSGLTKAETDLMEGFVPTEEPFVASTYYSRNIVSDDVLYFINMKDGGRLYKYDFSTAISSRITSLEVADFSIHDNVLYYATVRIKTSFDLYSLDLTTGKETRLSKDKCYHLSFAEDGIYYLNFSGQNTLNRMNYDGTDDTVIFEDCGTDDYPTTIYGNKLYFVADNDLYSYDLSTRDSATKVSTKIKNVADYIITDDGKLCYTQDNAASNKVVVFDLASATVVTEVSCGMLQMPKSYFLYDGYLYYFRHSEASSSGTGLYRIALSADSEAQQITTFSEDNYIGAPCVYNNKLYFTDTWFANDAIPTSGSYNIICYDLKTGEIQVFIS